jgi:hypothetical protein
MKRRQFIRLGFIALAAGTARLVTACSKKDDVPRRLGNQDGLWNATTATDQPNIPIELSYAKDTPAFFRDESLGKADPNFKPQTGGG